jgi:hypothetical protein
MDPDGSLWVRGPLMSLDGFMLVQISLVVSQLFYMTSYIIPMAPNEFIWIPLCPFGFLWVHLDPYGTLWGCQRLLTTFLKQHNTT